MHKNLMKHLDLASIYLVGVLFMVSLVDYVSIDQSRKVSGLTMLLLVMGILLSRVMLRQSRQMRAMKDQLKILTAAKAASSVAAKMPNAAASVVLPPVPTGPMVPSNVVELHRR